MLISKSDLRRTLTDYPTDRLPADARLKSHAPTPSAGTARMQFTVRLRPFLCTPADGGRCGRAAPFLLVAAA